ncbi:MAG: hypothetical protein A2288_03665 [Candidatus Moranbacteria bacterium RIFOXYA12_FULL_44_15]|nr:MAG: hypothetical protein A2288_03665 [Candidatus Moranbacteria bacterium RIFOXYA12_FULL_44_15]
MSLYDIKNKLYKKDEDANLSAHGTSEYNPRAESARPENNLAEGDAWAEKQTGFDAEQKKAIGKGAIALAGVLGIILLALGFYFLKYWSFSEERMKLEIAGPDKAQSGKLLTYEIRYDNNNHAGLENAVLKITYPESFKPEENPNFKPESLTSGTFDLGNIAGRGQGKAIFNGRIYSSKGALVYLKAEMIFTPSGFSTQYVSQNQLGINVDSTPLEIEAMAPQNVSSGDEINYLISYKNTGPEDLEGIRIRAVYPAGFSFSSSVPRVFEGDNIWYIGRVSAGGSGKVEISGKLEGNRDEIRVMEASVGTFESGAFVAYGGENVSTKIVSSPLIISQIVNGARSLNVNAGEGLNFEISYKNEGTIGLKNVIVTETLDSPVLDYSELDSTGGYYDAEKKTITWKASDHPELKNLEPGKGGMIRFSIKVKNVIPIASANDKNFVISSISKIDSPDIPTPISMNKIIAGNKMDMKLNSKLVLDVKGYHTDPNISNSGAIPPKVGQETTYAIHWIARNVSNDVTSARVESVLPTGVTMTGKIFPEDAKVSYNERNNSISWEIGNIGAGTGILSSPKEVSFQVKVKPSVEQVGREMPLLNSSTFSAKDSFTGADLSVVFEGKTTELREDASLGSNYKVME